MNRSLKTYMAIVPRMVTGGSEAQMNHFVIDAKADIAALATELSFARARLEIILDDILGGVMPLTDSIEAAIARINKTLADEKKAA